MQVCISSMGVWQAMVLCTCIHGGLAHCQPVCMDAGPSTGKSEATQTSHSQRQTQCMMSLSSAHVVTSSRICMQTTCATTATKPHGEPTGVASAPDATSHWTARTRTCANIATMHPASTKLTYAHTVANSSESKPEACARHATQSKEHTMASAYDARTDVQSRPKAYACHATTSTGMNTNDTID